MKPASKLSPGWPDSNQSPYQPSVGASSYYDAPPTYAHGNGNIHVLIEPDDCQILMPMPGYTTIRSPPSLDADFQVGITLIAVCQTRVRVKSKQPYLVNRTRYTTTLTNVSISTTTTTTTNKTKKTKKKNFSYGTKIAVTLKKSNMIGAGSFKGVVHPRTLLLKNVYFLKK